MPRRLNHKRNNKIAHAVIEDAEAELSARTSSPINRAATRAMIFNLLEMTRPALVGKLTRVSENSFTYLESRMRNIIVNELTIHPTKGQTIRIGGR